jgi:hypothetical protein
MGSLAHSRVVSQTTASGLEVRTQGPLLPVEI